MVTAIPKSQLFEEHRIPTEGTDLLHAKLMLPKPPMAPKRLVFIPPLIGAGASQQLIIFRKLTRRGCALLSFEYRGHPRSTGVFDLDATIVDTKHALRWAAEYAQGRGLPLHGYATCYAAIALAAQFSDRDRSARLWSFSSVSGLLRMDQILRFEDFAHVYGRYLGKTPTVGQLKDDIAADRIDFGGDTFRGALHEYLSTLFDELDIRRDRFEDLDYDRVEIQATLHQLAQAGYLDGLVVPADVPCNFIMGRRDGFLSLKTEVGREAYRNHTRSVIPHAEVEEYEIDHFGRGPERQCVIDRVGDFFEECEVRAVPLGLPNSTRPVEDVSP